jgi:hypothetical protein
LKLNTFEGVKGDVVLEVLSLHAALVQKYKY